MFGVLDPVVRLTGCIDFNPNRNNRHHGDLGAVVEAEAENPQDDAAMDRSSHLKFKGVPIDGTLKEFVGRMKRHGFEVEESGNGAAVLSEDFAAFKSCTVYVETLTGKDLVARIAVGFPFRDHWGTLYGDYAHLKSLLTEKYGEPASCVEEFQNSYGSRDDSGKCTLPSLMNVNMKRALPPITARSFFVFGVMIRGGASLRWSIGTRRTTTLSGSMR